MPKSFPLFPGVEAPELGSAKLGMSGEISGGEGERIPEPTEVAAL